MDNRVGQSKQSEPRASRTFGMSANEFYAALRDRQVNITTTDAKVYSGVLAGLDLYDLVIRQQSGAVVLVAKHAIKTVAGAPANGGQNLNQVIAGAIGAK